MHKKLVLLAISAMLIATVGCGSDNPPVEVVTGTVMYNGAPLAEATVSFHPDSLNVRGTASRVSSGETDAQGNFRLITNFMDGGGIVKLDGAPVGKYNVTVTKLEKPDVVMEDVGPPPDDIEGNAGANAEAMAEDMIEMGNMTEGGEPVAFEEASLISKAFRLSYQTPLKDVEVVEGENSFTIDLNENGKGTVQ
jgi:hypothetical protein